MKKITETYLLDCSTADIPVPHDCEIGIYWRKAIA